MPAAVLAKGIVTRALRTKPAVYYSAGGKAFVFWILERLPRWIVWRTSPPSPSPQFSAERTRAGLLSRMLGTDQVGK